MNELKDENINITREKMIEFIYKNLVWWKYNKWKNDKKEFYLYRIIYDNNQEQELFTSWEKMQNEIPIIENDLADDHKETEAIVEDMELDI